MIAPLRTKAVGRAITKVVIPEEHTEIEILVLIFTLPFSLHNTYIYPSKKQISSGQVKTPIKRAVE